MVIRASAAAEINALIADLGSSSAVERDAAVARLTVIGARAVDRLCAVAADGPPRARDAALRALEQIGSPRAFDAAAAALASPDTAIPGVALLRRLIRGAKETEAIEALTTVALDAARPSALRVAAAKALGNLGPTALKPLWEELERDRDPDVRALVSERHVEEPLDAARPKAESAGLEALAQAGPGDDPAIVRRAIAREGATAPLTVLRRLVELLRTREESAPARQRAEWASARAAAHVALAGRGSRIALYDLRESIEHAEGPLPVEFLAAVTQVGDASCLEPLAAAYARSTRSGEDWWRQHLRRAFHTIVQRDRIGRRHAAMKKVLARWPAIVR